MDQHQFDLATRAIESGVRRRRVLGTFFAATVAAPLLGFATGAGTDARGKKHRKRRKKIKRNSFGCVNVGQKCYGKSNVCCSGVCNGSGKRSTCAGHNALNCAPSPDTCSENVPCGSDGVCFGTTGNAPFCGKDGTCFCKACVTDLDCVATHGAGAACVQCLSDCNGIGGSSGTACVPAAQA